METKNKQSEFTREIKKVNSGLPLVVSISQGKSYIIAQKVELLKSEVQNLGESKFYGKLILVLASGDEIELDYYFQIDMDNNVIPDELTGIDIEYMYASLLSVLIVDRFYDRLLKTKVEGSRRTIVWEIFCSSVVDTIRDELAALAPDFIVNM